MKKTHLLLWTGLISAGLFLSVPKAAATPPQEVNLSYDARKQILQVGIAHVTRDLKQHYIRQIAVRKNNEEPIIKYLFRQTAERFTQDIPLTVAPGDEIAVMVSCVKGGSKEASLALPEEEEGKK